MIFDLPRSVEFGGREWEISTDFRDVLTVLMAFEDPNMQDSEKVYVCLFNMYPDFEDIPRDQMQEAYNAAVAFIDHGGGGQNGPRTMDWEQDANLIFPAVNSVAGCEVRALEYLHWWTFLGYFMEIKEGTASMVFSLRQKKAKGKKLEKWEREYWNENKKVCQLKRKLTDEEQAEEERLKALLG